MASQPGPLTHWPWQKLGNFKDNEERNAAKDVYFIPFSQFPPKAVRKDCFYHSTPAMRTPREYEDLHTCKNWLPRRVMSAWRVAGVVHALEGWDAHESGEIAMDVEKVWRAALDRGFLLFEDVECN